MKTSQKIITLSETLEPGLKHSLMSNFKKWTDAFLELVDNAVSNRVPGKKSIVEINNSRKHLRIVNKGGSGMDLEKLQEFLEWGKIKNRSSYDIGAYSQGGKSAMGYLGRAMKVTASPFGEYISYMFEDYDLHDFEKLKKYNVLELKTDYHDGFVEVQISELKRPIKDEELEWQFVRSGGHGGQNVNKVSTAARLTHIPTGIVVTASTERFQEQNRKIALNLLRGKLWILEKAKAENEKKGLKGDYRPASWGTQIRSYVLHPYKMVKDLRTQVETGNTDLVLDGEIDEFINAELKIK